MAGIDEQAMRLAGEQAPLANPILRILTLLKGLGADNTMSGAGARPSTTSQQVGPMAPGIMRADQAQAATGGAQAPAEGGGLMSTMMGLINPSPIPGVSMPDFLSMIGLTKDKKQQQQQAPAGGNFVDPASYGGERKPGVMY